MDLHELPGGFNVRDVDTYPHNIGKLGPEMRQAARHLLVDEPRLFAYVGTDKLAVVIEGTGSRNENQIARLQCAAITWADFGTVKKILVSCSILADSTFLYARGMESWRPFSFAEMFKMKAAARFAQDSGNS